MAKNETPSTPPDGSPKPDEPKSDDSAKDTKPNDQDSKSAGPFDPGRGTNIVFVLDRSLSMRQDEKSKAARRVLVSALEGLGTNKSFYVVFFPYQEMPTAGPMPATPENVRAMTNWIQSVGHAYGSDPTKALLRGLHFTPDTVWLLSDGQFSPSVARTIRDANEVLKAQIHTIGFYSRDGEPVMRQIADENHGTYHFVPRPDSK